MSTMKCVCCEKEAEYYCDYAFGWSAWEDDKERDRRVMLIDGEPITCDAPLCGECRSVVGRQFDIYGPGTMDTTDYCHIHLHAADESYLQNEISVGAAESIRLKDWKFKYYQRGLR